MASWEGGQVVGFVPGPGALRGELSNLSCASGAECDPPCDPKNGFCEDDSVCR